MCRVIKSLPRECYGGIYTLIDSHVSGASVVRQAVRRWIDRSEEEEGPHWFVDA